MSSSESDSDPEKYQFDKGAKIYYSSAGVGARSRIKTISNKTTSSNSSSKHNAITPTKEEHKTKRLPKPAATVGGSNIARNVNKRRRLEEPAATLGGSIAGNDVKRRRLAEPAATVGASINDSGNDDEDLTIIDKAEYESKTAAAAAATRRKAKLVPSAAADDLALIGNAPPSPRAFVHIGNELDEYMQTHFLEVGDALALTPFSTIGNANRPIAFLKIGDEINEYLKTQSTESDEEEEEDEEEKEEEEDPVSKDIKIEKIEKIDESEFISKRSQPLEVVREEGNADRPIAFVTIGPEIDEYLQTHSSESEEEEEEEDEEEDEDTVSEDNKVEEIDESEFITKKSQPCVVVRNEGSSRGVASRTRTKLSSTSPAEVVYSDSMDSSPTVKSRSDGDEVSSKPPAEEMVKNYEVNELCPGDQSQVAAKPSAVDQEDNTEVYNELHPKDLSLQADLPSHYKNNYDQSDGDAAASKPAEEGLKENELYPEDQSQVAAKPCAVQEKRKKGCNNELYPKKKSQADLPSYSKNDFDLSDDDEEDHADDTGEKTEAASSVPTGRHHKVCSMLADVVLGSAQMSENFGNQIISKQAPATQIQYTPLPLKFRFEDLVPKPVEKTAHEMEMEDLFTEMAQSLALEEVQTIKYSEVNLESEKSPAEETQYERCCRGKHELVLYDDEGLICIFCHHEELGPKDVYPEWAVIPPGESARKRYSEAEESVEEFQGHPLQSSIINVAADCNATGSVWSIKPGVRESMYEHQQEGFEFLWRNLAGSISLDEVKKGKSSDSGGCIISHAPGTGKTRLTIVFLETYIKMFPDCMPMIICPAGMLLTWEEEIKKWNIDYPFINLNSSDLSAKEKRIVSHLSPATSREMEYIRMIKMFLWSRGGSILGISYSLFEKLTGKEKVGDKMKQILLEKPGVVFLDEGHTPRNQRSNIWNALLKLETQKRVILSGTPFQNNFAELFNTLRLVRPAVADALAQEKKYADMVASRRSSLLSHSISEGSVENLKARMSPFVHVHKGTILQQSLPGLRDCVVVLRPPKLQQSLIERIRGSKNNFKFEHDIALVSVHPYLFLHCESTEAQKGGINMDAVEASKLIPEEGVKTRFVMELVRLCSAVDEKVVVFSQYLQPLQLIKEQLEERLKWVEGSHILQMRGKIQQKQRQILINQFNDPKGESKIMLASTRCCSEGISLIGASRVVLLDVVWNPSVERQAISRAYRIGQKKFVHTYHLMTSGTTEADKYRRQAEKEKLSELVFTSANEQKHLSFGKEDSILDLMFDHQNSKGIFENIINQPKETDLIQSFGLTC